MKYDIQAVETVYKGITFRSRLEATWAAMFDLLGWRWEYECDPINGWLPDFIVEAKYPGSYIPVEVKPIFELDYETADKVSKSSRKSLHDEPEPLILGLGPQDDYDTAILRLGWLNQWSETDGGCGVSWEPAGIIMDGGQYSLSTTLDDQYPRKCYISRMTGKRIVDQDVVWCRSSVIMELWGTAKKTVRYRPR